MTLVLLARVLSGCMLGPRLRQTHARRQESYRFANATLAAVPLIVPSEPWWNGFGDPELENPVAEGLVANHDLHITNGRVAEFPASVAASRRGLSGMAAAQPGGALAPRE